MTYMYTERSVASMLGCHQRCSEKYAWKNVSGRRREAEERLKYLFQSCCVRLLMEISVFKMKNILISISKQSSFLHNFNVFTSITTCWLMPFHAGFETTFHRIVYLEALLYFVFSTVILFGHCSSLWKNSMNSAFLVFFCYFPFSGSRIEL